MNNSVCSKCKKEPKYKNSSWCNHCINARKRDLRAEKKAIGLKQYGEKRKKTCRLCKLPKEENYMNDSLCQTCRSETNHNKRVAERAKKGLLAWGMGRKLTCSTCGKLKEHGRDNESRCKSCKAQAYEKNRRQARFEMGLNPLGFGRKETCCRCGKIKEKISKGYCNSCDAISESERRYNKVSTEEGKIFERLSYKNKMLNEEFRIKNAARKALNFCVRGGIIKKQPCEICGNPKSEGHHDDYMKPLDVRWLCRKHHVEYHNSRKEVLT